MREAIRFSFVMSIIVAIVICAIIWPLYGLSGIAILLFGIGLYDIFQKKHTILRNFPLLGHMRYLLEMIGPEIHQYFIEDDTEGKPIDRNQRAYVYTRAKLGIDTHPFGTQLNVNEDFFSFMKHSVYPAEVLEQPPRVTIGGPDCKQPYSSSIFNISAMSYGSLSKNAITALNLGAKAGNFYHVTGEGGVSPYHRMGGDIVFQLGTGYFGARTIDGDFNPEMFREKALWPEVKMIEVKLSQGAKPGHGGVLPASKNNKEIAEIRGIEPHTDVLSPFGHKAFDDDEGLLKFIQQLRELSDGKPVGFKLAIGSKREFRNICEKMVETGIKPDFITVDGAEGGTGAAPIDFSNYVGMPWEESLIFVTNTLNGYGLKKDIKVITATKIFTAFDIYKAFCIGADVCNSARGMMLALGCIQALKCHTNKCPTGVATNNPTLVRGLNVDDKWKRVRNYQQRTVEDFTELFAASGCTELSQLNRRMIYKKLHDNIKSYETYYPTVEYGDYIKAM